MLKTVITNVLSGLMNAALALGLLVIFATSSQAQQPPTTQGSTFRSCGTVDVVLERLTDPDKFGETMQWTLPNNASPNTGGWTAFFANGGTGSWTLVVMGPHMPGFLCVVQYGFGFGGVFPDGAAPGTAPMPELEVDPVLQFKNDDGELL